MDINDTQHAQVNFPIIADKDRKVSMLFGMLDATSFRHGPKLGQTMTVRNVYICSPSKRVELILSYPAVIGRSFNEILRVVDALRLAAKHRVATPANSQPGDDTVVLPFVSDEEAERLFADRGGFRRVRSYLRFVRDPSLRSLCGCPTDGEHGRVGSLASGVLGQNDGAVGRHSRQRSVAGRSHHLLASPAR